jgi:hypothetical protein
MPSDASVDDQWYVSRNRRPLWRRIRVRAGSAWTPDQTLQENRDTGLICKDCHKRIKYKDLDCVYEKQGSDLFRLWMCGYCGLLVRSDNMTDLAFVYEERRNVL